MSPELKDENSQISWEKRSVCGKDDEKILDYSPRIPFSFFSAQLFFAR